MLLQRNMFLPPKPPSGALRLTDKSDYWFFHCQHMPNCAIHLLKVPFLGFCPSPAVQQSQPSCPAVPAQLSSSPSPAVLRCSGAVLRTCHKIQLPGSPTTSMLNHLLH